MHAQEQLISRHLCHWRIQIVYHQWCVFVILDYIRPHYFSAPGAQLSLSGQSAARDQGCGRCLVKALLDTVTCGRRLTALGAKAVTTALWCQRVKPTVDASAAGGRRGLGHACRTLKAGTNRILTHTTFRTLVAGMSSILCLPTSSKTKSATGPDITQRRLTDTTNQTVRLWRIACIMRGIGFLHPRYPDLPHTRCNACMSPAEAVS